MTAQQYLDQTEQATDPRIVKAREVIMANQQKIAALEAQLNDVALTPELIVPLELIADQRGLIEAFQAKCDSLATFANEAPGAPRG